MSDLKSLSQAGWMGKSAEFQVSLEPALIEKFAELSGDRNPIHLSNDHALSLGFASRVAHGMLLAGLVSRLVGEYLPGGDVLLLSIKVDFHQPSHAGDLLNVSGCVVNESSATRTLEIQFQIQHGRGIACKGKVLVQLQNKLPA